MVQPATSNLILPRRSQEGILAFHRQAYTQLNQQWNIREQMRQIDLKYIRENDWTTEQQRAKLSNKYGDSNRFQNITVPIIMPQVTSAVTYQASVFLTGTPIFGVVSDPQNEDEALQLETVIDNAATRGGWVREFLLGLTDAFKYNLACMEVSWEQEVTAVLETDLEFSTIRAKPKEVIWEGSCIHRCDPYNTFFDSRVPITEHHKRGEFGGYTKIMSRMELKMFLQRLPSRMNVTEAFESGLGSSLGGFASGGIESYYIPQINPEALINKNPRTSMDWMAWAQIAGTQTSIMYKNMYEVTTLYGRIIPSDFGLKVPSANTPQIWKFIIVNHQVIVYCERLTNAHNYLPLFFAQPLEDGLSYQTKGFAKNIEPIQDVTTAMMNSMIASRRRAISDRGIYDPSRISESHINSANPSAKIPVRPSAYGKNVAEAYHQIPFRDDTAGQVMQEIQMLTGFANTITFQNQARQGQFVKGNKTLHEYADVMAHANGPAQVQAMLLEAQWFTPIKEVLKLDTLQYQGGVSLFNRDKQRNVKIDPIKLRQAVMQFKVTDGLTPTEKLISGDAWTTAMQVIGSSPQISQEYNIAPMFSYLMKTQRADLRPFEKSPEQRTYEQAVASWQQVVLEAIKQGADQTKLPLQPKPQDYGYNPQQQGGPQAQAPAPNYRTTVATNNITNNITDNRA
jgi:hypothetical protein